MGKKNRQRPPGSRMTSSERRALNREIERQLAEYDRKHEDEITAIVLWSVYQHFDLSIDDLKVFYDSFNSKLQGLIERYEMDREDEVWLCTHKLNDIGVDLTKWKGGEESERG